MPLIPHNREIILTGIPVSPGIAVAPVQVEARGMQPPEVYSITEDEVEHERQRLQKALEKTRKQLSKIQQKIEAISGEDDALIFEAHIMILEDAALLKKVYDGIAERLQNAEFVYYAVVQTYCEAIRRINDSYLADRAVDIDDVAQRVLRNFDSEAKKRSKQHDPDHKHIIVSYDLSPSATATMDRSKVLGFITEQGSINSHTSIIARSLGIPAIVGVPEAVVKIKSLTRVILDGYTGKVILNPSEATLTKYRNIQKRKQEIETDLESLKESPTQTLDGHRITLSANIEFEHELPLVEQVGAEGIGLFRTEFYLLGGGEIPDENNQTTVYTKIAKHMKANEMAIIRTLDAGGDKLPVEPLSEPEPNPFLGWRGIRVSLDRQGMFKEQLRAILRASAHGNLGIMFPLVSGVNELIMAKDCLHECMQELSKENVPFDNNLKIGVMIEVPSAAIMADFLAKEVDFFSIGTNDLIQYTLAVDRVNKYVSSLYKPTNPAITRLIDMTAKAAQNNNIWAGICGEMAGDLHLTPLLIGLGITELSVGNHQLPKIKKAIRSLKLSECSAMAQQALKAKFSHEILELSSNLARQYYGYLLD